MSHWGTVIFGVSFHQGELPVRPSALVPNGGGGEVRTLTYPPGDQRECVPGGRDDDRTSDGLLYLSPPRVGIFGLAWDLISGLRD